MPLSAALAWSAASAFADVASLGAGASAPFLAGMGLTAATWALGRYVVEPRGALAWGARGARWAYVLGHELTHALAAWASGGKVFAIKVGEDGGHVDLSESGAFVALAPYCVPFHALLVVVGYRLLLWLRPAAQADSLFLLLMGGALAFHGLMTWQTLTQVRQPDLAAAGGAVFSAALIVLVNGAAMLLLLKALFPEAVPLAARLRQAGEAAWGFWTGAWGWTAPAARRAWASWRAA